jgi:hypothetical protein
VSVFNGVATGIVKEIDNKLGRVRVNLPWLSDDNKTYWARVATLMAGKGRGSWFMPEVGDEVLLGFEMGKIDHPYVLGFLWNEPEPPPIKDDEISEKVRRLRTVSDHRIDFDDRDDKQRIYIQSHSKHSIEMNDTSQPFVSAKTNGERYLRLDDDQKKIQLAGPNDLPMVELDDQPKKITIRTGSSDPSVVLDDTQQSVTITVGQNSIKVDPTGVTITANGMTQINVTGNLTIKGSIVSIESDGPLTLQGSAVTVVASGVLSVTAPISSFAGPVQATGIISPMYTPGVGNLL